MRKKILACLMVLFLSIISLSIVIIPSLTVTTAPELDLVQARIEGVSVSNGFPSNNYAIYFGATFERIYQSYGNAFTTDSGYGSGLSTSQTHTPSNYYRLGSGTSTLAQGSSYIPGGWATVPQSLMYAPCKGTVSMVLFIELSYACGITTCYTHSSSAEWCFSYNTVYYNTGTFYFSDLGGTLSVDLEILA